MARKKPAPDPALITRLTNIISALEEERRSLAGRLAAIDEELSQLASVIASHEDLRNALPRP